MAGVYFKGMRMPDYCKPPRGCPMRHGSMCAVTGKYYEGTGWLQPSDCPAVFVPHHGRLIDESWLKATMISTLEALKKNLSMDMQEMHLIAAFDTLAVMIADAPTIIPADKEAENG